MKAKTCVVFSVLVVLALILGGTATRTTGAVPAAAPQPPEEAAFIGGEDHSSLLGPEPSFARVTTSDPEAVTPAQEASRMALIGQAV